ncbi:hypothetical protein Asp14428_50340 [Actinoplanes sp. NBRC 14428]|nr:hypothetical protein Asp14428_50340 [Actinoplanes sp. NBRC 14428]
MEGREVDHDAGYRPFQQLREEVVELGGGVGVELALEFEHGYVGAMVGHGGVHGIAFGLVGGGSRVGVAEQLMAHKASVRITRKHPHCACGCS